MACNRGTFGQSSTDIRIQGSEARYPSRGWIEPRLLRVASRHDQEARVSEFAQFKDGVEGTNCVVNCELYDDNILPLTIGGR